MKTSTVKSARRLMGSASLVVLGLMAVTAAHAQDAAPKADETVVVVTGQRAQLKNAQKIKKDADVIVDSVTAVDIGALPDRSVSEALQRISGLTIQRADEANDPIRMSAEGGGVAIRGLSWVRSETNGRDIFSAKNGRSLSFSDVSADLLAGVDVYKNPSASMIEGGIGGTVNLRTRLPFDSKGRVIAFSVDDTYGDLQQTHHNSASFIVSDRWHTSVGDVGALFNYSLSNEGNHTDVIGVDRYNAVTVGAATKYVPNTMGWRTIDWNQKRTAAALALQWRPNADLLITLQAFNAKAEPKNTEYNTGFYNDTGEFTSSASMATYSYDADGVFKKGTVKGASITSNTRYGENHNDTTDISLGVKWDVSDKLTLNGDVQYVKSTAHVLSNTAFVQIATRPDATIDLNGDLPVLTIASPNVTNVESQYWWAAAMDHIEKNDGKQLSARLDGEFKIDSGWMDSFKFGVRTTDKDYNTRQSGYNWGLLSNQYWGNGGGAPVYLSGAQGTNYPFDNFMHSDVPVPGSIWFPNASIVNTTTAHTYDVLKSTETSGWGWTPLSDNYNTYASSGGLNTQNEKTTAAYAQLKFAGEVNLGGSERVLDGNVGVRVVKTEVNGSSYIVVTAPNTPVGYTCTANCAVLNSANTFGFGTIPYTGHQEYSNTLPSLNVRLKWNNELQFRFAASKGLVRPDMAWINPYSSLSSNFTIQNTGVNKFSVVQADLSGTGGNPSLRPITANQYDLTAEWYFNPTGSLTLALFHKDLTDYIYTQTQAETYTNNGATLTFNVARHANGTEKGKLDGYELAYQQFYDFLPAPFNGIGVQANYTHLDSSGGRNSDGVINALPLEGMSPDSYNWALMYEKYGISARIAYNWRSNYLYTTSAANVNRPLWSGDYGQLDGSFFYTLNSHYKVGLQATNLGKSTTYQRVSSDVSKPLITQFYSAIQTDRRISLVLRGSF